MDPSKLMPWKRRARQPLDPEMVSKGAEEAGLALPDPEPQDETLGAENEATMASVISVLSGKEAEAPPAPAGPGREPGAKPALRVVGDEAPAVAGTEMPRGAKVAPARARPPASGATPPKDTPSQGIPDTPATASARAPRLALPKIAIPRRRLPLMRFDLTGWRPLAPFLVATLGPVPLLLLSGLLGGVWCLLALLSMTAVHFCLDEIAGRRGFAETRTSNPEPGTFQRAQRLSLYLAGLHFVMLFFAVWALSGAAGFGFFGWIAAFLAFGLWFGQVSNSNAHELIHRAEKWPFRAGMWVYISLLFGHHTSAHRLVHHRFVATTDDPNTAAEGENFYQFAARAWPGAFVAGYEMECNLREERKPGGIAAFNPYWLYLAGGAGFVLVMGLLFGLDGLLAYLLLAAHAQVQLLLSDYVQHYGLLRRKLPSGLLEPASLQHSWDAPHPVSGFMMLNAARHSDHHIHPSRAYPALRLSPAGRTPVLPYSLPAMATIALAPTLWHRVMDRRLAVLKAGRAA